MPYYTVCRNRHGPVCRISAMPDIGFHREDPFPSLPPEYGSHARQSAHSASDFHRKRASFPASDFCRNPKRQPRPYRISKAVSTGSEHIPAPFFSKATVPPPSHIFFAAAQSQWKQSLSAAPDIAVQKPDPHIRPLTGRRSRALRFSHAPKSHAAIWLCQTGQS